MYQVFFGNLVLGFDGVSTASTSDAYASTLTAVIYGGTTSGYNGVHTLPLLLTTLFRLKVTSPMFLTGTDKFGLLAQLQTQLRMGFIPQMSVPVGPLGAEAVDNDQNYDWIKISETTL